MKSSYPIPFRSGDYNMYADPFTPPTNISSRSTQILEQDKKLGDVDHVDDVYNDDDYDGDDQEEEDDEEEENVDGDNDTGAGDYELV